MFFLLYSLYFSVLFADSCLLAGHRNFLAFWGISFHWKQALFKYTSYARATESLSRKRSPHTDSSSILLVLPYPGLWSWGSQVIPLEVPLLYSPSLGYPWGADATPITWDKAKSMFWVFFCFISSQTVAPSQKLLFKNSSFSTEFEI